MKNITIISIIIGIIIFANLAKGIINQNYGEDLLIINGEISPQQISYIETTFQGINWIQIEEGKTWINTNLEIIDNIKIHIYVNRINKMIERETENINLEGTNLANIGGCVKASDGTWVTPQIINNLGTYQEVWTPNPLCQTLIPSVSIGGTGL